MGEDLKQRILIGIQTKEVFNSEWKALVRVNPTSTVFQTGPWYQAWIESVSKKERTEPVIIKVTGSQVLRAALGLQIRRKADGSRCIQPLSSPWADYHEAIAHPKDVKAIDALSHAVAQSIRELGFPLECTEVITGGILETVLNRLNAVKISVSQTGQIDLTDRKHVEKILNRREYKLKMRRLLRFGHIRCRYHFEEKAILACLPAFITMHRKQWKGRLNTVAPFDGGVVDCAFETMVKYLAPQGYLGMVELLLDNQSIAMYFGFLFRRCYFAYRTTYDLELSKYSPGHIMLVKMVEDFLDRGLRYIDLMRGNYDYKKQYINKFKKSLALNFE